MIIKTTSQTIKNIWVVFLLIFALAILLFIVLSQGIRINKLDLPKVNIEQLYIKLDKKLIVYAKEVNIEVTSEKKNSFAQIHGITNYLDILHGLFKTVSIQNLNFGEKNIKLLYKDEVFYVDSDLLTIDAKIRPWEKDIELVIKQMTLKDYSLRLKGNLKADFREDNFRFQGTFSTFNINGSINAMIEDGFLYYQVASKEFDSLDPFMNFLASKVSMEKLLKEWIHKRIIAKEYKLKNLQGKINMKDGNFYPHLMDGTALTKDVHVKFHKDAPPVKISDLGVQLKNNTLYFDMKNATYEEKDMSNSDVHIYNLMTKGAGIIIDIKTNALLDKTIQNTLSAFDIDVPIVQTNGMVQSNVILDILFEPYSIKNYIGLFTIDGANFKLSSVPMYSKSGTVRLDNNKLYLSDVNLKYNSLFDIYTTGVFDLKKGIYEAKNSIKNLSLNFKQTKLLEIKDIMSESLLKIDKNATIIDINALKTQLKFEKDTNSIHLKDLNLLTQYSPLLKDFDMQKGDLLLQTQNFETFDIDTNIYANFPLEKNGNKISQLDLNIFTDGKAIQAHTQDKDISLEYSDNRLLLNIKNHDILFDSTSKNKDFPIDSISIEGRNSGIKDTNSSLFLPPMRYSIRVDSNETLFQGKQKKQETFIKNATDELYINSMSMKSDYLNKLADKEIFEGGTFDFYLQGSSIKKSKGLFTIKNSILKEGKFYNNLMAFFNTIPSLLTLKNPGFNETGYEIEKGFIDFTINKDTMHIKKIKFDGKSTDIDGSGKINLKTNEIDIALKIAVLKSFSSAVKNIPIVNYILLGDDGKLYTNVKLTGKIDAPKVTSQAVTDAVISPFEMIKRTLQSPFKLFE